MLPVLGPSGCGKSSLARAGLIPELARRPLPGRKRARVTIFTPGTHPVEALAGVLAKIATNDISPVAKTREFASELKRVNDAKEYDGLRRIADLLPDITLSPLIVLVDQFEEVYSLCKDTTERQAFIENLLHATGDPAARVSLILTLRSDFLGETQKHITLSQAITGNGFIVPAMSRDELERAITLPAEQAGHPLDESTVKLLVKETEGREGALPLLQFALTRIWEGLREGIEPAVTLEDIGGVGGALAGEAQQIFDRLSEEEKAIARRVFLGLVQLGEGARDTRRRIEIKSLVSYKEKPEQVKKVIARFASVSARLITVSGVDETEMAEVTHEALFDHWQVLNGWLESSREDIRFQRRLEETARYWEKNGRSDGSLWRRPELDLLKSYHQRASHDMTPIQLSFFQASIRSDQCRKLLISLGIGAVTALAGISSMLALNAQRAEQKAVARQLAAQSELMRNEKVELIEQSVLLAVEAQKRSPTPILEAGQAIHHGLNLLPRPFKGLEQEDSSPLTHTFSSDGKYLAAGNIDGSLELWEMSTGRKFSTFEHADPVDIVVFSRNKANVISVTSKNVVTVWKLATKSMVSQLQFEGKLVGFIEDAKYIAIISPDNTVLRVLELKSGHEINRIPLGNPIKPPVGPPVRLSLNGKYLATVDVKDKNAALVREVKSSKIIARLEHAQKGTSPQEAYINDIEFSPDSSLLTTAGKGNIVRLWNINTGQEVGILPHEDRVGKLVFSPDGKYLVTATSNRKLQVWNLDDRRVVAKLTLDKPLSTSLAVQSIGLVFSGDSTHLAITDSVDNVSTARILSLAEGKEVARTLLADRPIKIALNPDGKYIAIRSSDDKTRLLEIDNGSQITRLSLFYGASGIAFSPNQNYLATVGSYKFVRVWNLDNSSETHRFKHNSSITTAAFSHDGKYLLTGTLDGVARLWDVENEQELSPINLSWKMEGEQELRSLNLSRDLRCVTFSPNGEYLVTVGGENNTTTIVWDTNKDHEVTRIKHTSALKEATFSSNLKYLATATEDGSVIVWNLLSGKEIIRLKHEQRVTALAFSRYGDRLATGSEDGTVQSWRLMDGREMLNIKHDGPVNSLAFSPDAKYLATAADKSIMIWDIARNQAQEWFRVTEGSGALAVAFSPDGKFLAVGSGAGVTVWLWRPTDLISEACQRLTRNLSRKEWERYLGDESYQPTCPGLPVPDQESEKFQGI